MPRLSELKYLPAECAFVLSYVVILSTVEDFISDIARQFRLYVDVYS